jgi:thiosulfate/3-mercaptopyruvate sulfurtransferase
MPGPLLCLALLLSPAADRQANAYPRSDLLIEASDLARPGAAQGLVILDARGRGNYLDGHIPGAVRIDPGAWDRAFTAGQDEKAWARRIGTLGIDTGSHVVVYDDSRSKEAARMWWILRYWGVRDVRLLNGGWRAWLAAGGPVEKSENRPRPVQPKLLRQPERFVTRNQVLASLRGGPQILDARSTEEYCGTAETAKRNGSIPGARHLEWSDTIDRKTGRFKSAADLTRLFREAGIDPGRPAITHCQSGGRASVLAFVLELMGDKEVRNYYRGWSEWGNDPDTPIAHPRPGK